MKIDLREETCNNNHLVPKKTPKHLSSNRIDELSAMRVKLVNLYGRTRLKLE